MFRRFVATAAVLVASTSAFATCAPPTVCVAPTYAYSWDGTGVGTGGYGTSITKWNTSYATSSGRDLLGMDVAYANHTPLGDDGFWFVLNAGGNPKGIVNELPIFFGDLKNNKITAYVYDGQNGPGSWATQPYLKSYNNAFTISGSSFSFNIDVTSLNSLNLGGNWKGVNFAQELGVWYHPIATAGFTYDQAGKKITNLTATNSGWFDSGSVKTSAKCGAGFFIDASGKCCPITTQVPEPGSLGLLGLGVAGLGYALRRRQTA
jgi:PEP-CTERM motif